MTPGLAKFSDDAVKFIDALVDSGAMTDALKGIQGGLQWLELRIGSAEFKQGAKQFLSGLETLGPYIANFVDYAAKVLRISGRFAYYGADLAGNPNYNPDLPTFLGDLAGQRQPGRGVPRPFASVGSGSSSIRYYAGRGSSRPPYGGVIDSATGKLLPRPQFLYSPSNDPTKVAGISAKEIQPLANETPSHLYDRIRATYPHLSNEQCVTLVRAVAGIKENVWDWRRGVGVGEGNLPTGTPVATFLDRSGKPSEFYDAHQGVGAPGNNTTHTAILMGYTKDGILVSEQYVGSGGPQLHEYKWHDPRGGEKSAENYFAVNDLDGFAGGGRQSLSNERGGEDRRRSICGLRNVEKSQSVSEASRGTYPRSHGSWAASGTDRHPQSNGRFGPSHDQSTCGDAMMFKRKRKRCCSTSSKRREFYQALAAYNEALARLPPNWRDIAEGKARLPATWDEARAQLGDAFASAPGAVQ